MTNNTEDEKKEKEKEDRGKFGEAGAIGQTKTSIPPNLTAAMVRYGIRMAVITEILRVWSHLKGEALIRALVEFAKVPARASAHLIVQFDVKKGFALVTNFLSYLSGRDKSPTSKSSPDQNPPSPR